MKIDRLKTDLAKAKEKAAEWQARVRDLEKQITEQENLEILQVVRGVAASAGARPGSPTGCSAGCGTSPRWWGTA